MPKLRFPEFRGAEGWKSKRLGDLFSDRQEAGLTGLPLLSLMDKEGIVPQEDSNRKNNSNSDKSKYLRVVPGDIAYNTMRMWEGRSAFVGLEGLVSPAYTVCEPKPGVHSLLFSYYFKTPQLIEQFRRYSQGLVKDTLNLKYAAFSQISTFIPTLPEQQKIAECLSSVDELIGAQARKVDALKTHKKGLMQQLFPQEGQTQPRLRFPEFQNDGEWEEVALGDIAEIKLGKMLDKQKHTSGHLLPYLNNLAVRWNEVNTSDLPKMYFIDRELDRFGLRAGDVVVCEGGEPGRAAVWDGRLPDLKFQKAIHRVRFNVPFEPKILVLHLENLAGTTAFEMLFTGGGIKHLTGETFSRLKIPLIPHAEQQRIADCLSSLDDLITAETKKLEALKLHKKGLMQQLFPSSEEFEA
ncbi:MAG: restriction endonuclease subunit S [Kiritimatiellales bacterium]|nr:restriction endonuclease subunit S [Kiritimatiellales bacterium]